jgi:hypothetical protein
MFPQAVAIATRGWWQSAFEISEWARENSMHRGTAGEAAGGAAGTIGRSRHAEQRQLPTTLVVRGGLDSAVGGRGEYAQWSTAMCQRTA